MKLDQGPFYIPDEDEPSVFSSSVTVREYGIASYNDDQWGWPRWFKKKSSREYHEMWKAKNPDKPTSHCPPFGFCNPMRPDPASVGIGLIMLLREELKAPDYPTFESATMFIGDTRQISLRWVLQYARDNNMSPESAVLVAEHERDQSSLTLDAQEIWQESWWKTIMELPGIAYPIWRYVAGYERVAIPYLLMPGPSSESIVIVRVHEKNPNITYKLVTISQKGGEVVGDFTGYEGFDREMLNQLLKGFWAGF